MKALWLVLLLTGCGITVNETGSSTAQPRALFSGNFMPTCWAMCTINNSLTNTESGMSGTLTGGALSNTQTQSLKLGGGAPTPPVVPVPVP